MPAIAEITPREAKELLERPDVILLDVREPDEVAHTCIEGSVHIPMNDIPQRISELSPASPIVVYCHHGMRSAQVASFLLRNGFSDVRNLRGGIDAWSLEIDASVRRY